MLDSTRIRTEIPGPKSKALMERRHGAVAAGIKTGTPIFAHEAKGATIVDVDGNSFIDFGGGIGTMNVGHSDPRVVEAIKEAADRFTHTCFFVNHYEPYVELAERPERDGPRRYGEADGVLQLRGGGGGERRSR